MKRIIYLTIMFMTVLVSGAMAQEKEMTRDEIRILEEKMDSLWFERAVKAINDRDFTLEAERVILKRGKAVYVTSNTNFVRVCGNDAVVQVSFSAPVDSPNGVGGITVEGSISSYNVTRSKKGNITVTMNVTGRGISAQLNFSMQKGSNRASVEISPNFNSNRTTLSGIILPNEYSNVFKGTSL